MKKIHELEEEISKLRERIAVLEAQPKFHSPIIINPVHPLISAPLPPCMPWYTPICISEYQATC